MMTDKEKLDLFLDLSVILTAYKRVHLLGTGLVFNYFEAVTERVGEDNSDSLWNAYKSILKAAEMGDVNIEDQIRIRIMSDPQCGPIARSIIKLWYLGQWDAMTPQWRARYGNHVADVTQILSSESYKEGLVWQAIAAHPMGAKQSGFDSWSHPPDLFEELP